MLVVQAVSAYRVKIITAAEALHSIGYQSLFRIQLISQFIAYGAPISALSDLAKAAMIKLRFDLPLGQSVRIVLYERICGALGAVVIGLLATSGQLASIYAKDSGGNSICCLGSRNIGRRHHPGHRRTKSDFGGR